MTENQLKYLSLQETMRHNAATEADAIANTTERARSNRANEWETNRANVAREAETNRSNTAKEKETKRHNQNTEYIDSKRYALDSDKLDETKRSNQENEDISRTRAEAAATSDLAKAITDGADMVLQWWKAFK